VPAASFFVVLEENLRIPSSKTYFKDGHILFFYQLPSVKNCCGYTEDENRQTPSSTVE
jgi:hypothetical protein